MIKTLAYFAANVSVLLLFNLFPNITIQLIPAIVFVLLLTLLNWTIIPIIKFLALPINTLSFGLVNSVINLGTLVIMMNVVRGITVNGTLGIQFIYATGMMIGFSFAQGIVNAFIDDENR